MAYRALLTPYLPTQPIGGSLTHVNIHCPFHADAKPSAVVYFNTGIFHCPVCALTLSATQFISRISGITLKEADIIVSEYQRHSGEFVQDDSYFSKTPTRNPNWDIMVQESINLLEENLEVVAEYLKRKQLSFETLRKAKVGYLPAERTHWKRDSLVFPYIIQKHVWGIRYRDISGLKSGEPGTTFSLWGIDDIPAKCDTVILVEGETDRLTAMEMFPNIPVVSTPTCKFKREWRRNFAGIQNIIVIPQDDLASENLTASAKEYLGNVTIAQIPWKRGQLGKDLNDWRAQSDTKEFVEDIERIAQTEEKLTISAEELLTYSDTQKFYISNIIAEGQFVCIVGPQKAKKSFTMFSLIRTLLGTGEFLGLPGAKNSTPVNHILVVEEEGTKSDLANRALSTLADVPDWKSRVTFLHKRGVKLDNPQWIDKLIEIIGETNTDVIFFDCLYKMHSQNEDKANEMQIVWQNIRKLQAKFPRLAVVLLAHFGKRGEIEKGWDSIRGSSSLGGEVDLAIFQEKQIIKNEEVIRIKFDGREIGDITDPDGNSILECTQYTSGIIELGYDKKAKAFFATNLYEDMKQLGSMGLKEASIKYGVTMQTIRNWVEKFDDLWITSPVRGRPATILFKETEAGTV